MSFKPIAVIGMSCYLPGAENYREYWENLVNGSLKYKRAEGGEEGSIDRPEKGVLGRSEYFDPTRFGITEKEAKLMDPQLRKFIELVDSALDDSGYPKGEKLKNVGVVASQGTNHTYHNELTRLIATGDIETPDTLLENINKGSDFLATRISYIYNFHGPSFNLQSACSSSLTALVESCYLLQSGRCDVVVCGGINISYPLNAGYRYEPGSIYSRTGYCRPFDQQADGTIPSDGGGVLILKRQVEAGADGDRIHGTVIAAGSNNDGNRKVSYAAPSTEGQFELLKSIYDRSGINPRELCFIECHATGTVVGDPIEVRSLQRLMQAFPSVGRPPVNLSSVKGEIGHLFWAAGIASTIKSLLSLKQGLLPGMKNLHSVNMLLELGETLAVPNGNCQLSAEQALRGAVSCFGVGGTNAHVVLEQIPRSRALEDESIKSHAGRVLSLISNKSSGKKFDDSEYRANSLKENTLSLTDLVEIYRAALEDASIEEDSDYFDHYGDSITAIGIIAEIKKRTVMDLTQDEIFSYRTPKELHQALSTKTKSLAKQEGPRNSLEENICISEFNKFQQRFYLMEKLNRSELSQYNVALCIEIDNVFPRDRFVNALAGILQKIPLVAQGVALQAGGLTSGVARKSLLKVTNVQVSDESELQQIASNLFGEKFDLDAGPACYVTFVDQGGNRESKLFVSMPHLYLDGKGLDNLLQAVAARMKDPEASIAEFVTQHEVFSLSGDSESYWEKYAGCLPETRMPFCRAVSPHSPPVPRFTTREWTEFLPLLRQCATKYAVSPFTVVFSLFFDYLAMNTLETNLCVGTTLINRKADSKSITCQINNVPIVVQPSAGNINDTLGKTRAVLAEVIRHSDAGYEEIANIVGKRGKPLYNLLLMFQNQNSGYSIEADGRLYCESRLRYNPLYTEACFNFTMLPNQMLCEISYDENVYITEEMVEVASSFEKHVKVKLLELLEE